MKARCYDQRHAAFHRYGGRGINVCDAWLASFDAFQEWAVNHPAYREGLTIERVDNDAGYCPENCTWIPRGEQVANRSISLIFEYQGEKKCLGWWAKDPRCLAPSKATLYQRIEHGWPFEKAFTTPGLSDGPVVKLDQALADEIREIRKQGTMTRSEIAKKFGVCYSILGDIFFGRSWVNESTTPLPQVRAKITEDQVRAIRADHVAGMLHREIAARYGVSRGNVTRILNRKAWVHVD
jgi:hypothetical protein